MSSITDRWNELEAKDSREAYAEAQIDVDVPFQIAALARSREMLLPDLAKVAGVPLSQLEGKRRISTNTLCRLAAHFDIALIVQFASFSEACRWERSFDPNTFKVLSFAEDKPPEENRWQRAASVDLSGLLEKAPVITGMIPLDVREPSGGFEENQTIEAIIANLGWSHRERRRLVYDIRAE